MQTQAATNLLAPAPGALLLLAYATALATAGALFTAHRDIA